MPNLTDIKNTINPTAIPAGTDLIYAYKSDGTPAAYTLDELAAYIAGVTLPTWTTDAAQGCLMRFTTGASTIQVQDGILVFNNTINDVGFHAGSGLYMFPASVTKISIVCGLVATNLTPKLRLIKNGDLANPLVTKTGNNGDVLLVAQDIPVIPTDTIEIRVDGAGYAYTTDSSFISIKTTEKTA